MTSHHPWWVGTLRIVGIVLLSITAAFTILGGAGTTCVALNPLGFGGKFSGIAPFQWLYILFVIVTLGIGIWTVRAVVLLVRARRGSYRLAVSLLAAGLLVGVIHIAASRLLRGGSMPVDMVAYTTLLTLLVFLLFRLPRIWERLGLEASSPDSGRGKSAVQIALAATGVLTLTVQFIMAPTHTVGGINYADVWHATLSFAGVTQLLIAAIMLIQQRLLLQRPYPVTESR